VQSEVITGNVLDLIQTILGKRLWQDNNKHITDLQWHNLKQGLIYFADKYCESVPEILEMYVKHLKAEKDESEKTTKHK